MVCTVKAVFCSSHVWTWELDHKKGWVPHKNPCFGTLVLEKTLECLLDYKEIKPVNPKGNQSWIFIRRTDAEAEIPTFWPPDEKNSFEETRMLGKIEGKRKRGQQRIRWLDSITNSMNINLSKLPETVKHTRLQSTGSQIVGHDSNWMTTPKKQQGI